MEDRAEILRRRIVLYHRQLLEGVEITEVVQYVAQILYDEAELRGLADLQNTNGHRSTACRSQAQRYRQLADQEADPERAELFRKLAATFDRDAAAEERRISQPLRV
jgi:hypothetical protein